VAGLVGHLDGEELHDLAEVGVDAAEEAGRHHQGGLLVLDQVGHDLHDGRLDLVGQLVGGQRGGGRPVHRGGRVPLRRQGLGVELRRHV
jgi:hypothetical protein